MDKINVKKLLEIANKYLKDPDTIIDPYDMTFVWLSEKSKKYAGNQVGKQIASVSKDPGGKIDFQSLNVEAGTIDYNIKKKKIAIQVGSEYKNVWINSVVIEFNNQPYLVSKFIKFEN